MISRRLSAPAVPPGRGFRRDGYFSGCLLSGLKDFLPVLVTEGRIGCGVSLVSWRLRGLAEACQNAAPLPGSQALASQVFAKDSNTGNGLIDGL